MAWLKSAWKEKLDRQKLIVCSTHATDPPSHFLKWIEVNRRLNRDEIDETTVAQEFPMDQETSEGLLDMRVLWEPIHTKKGEETLLFGWDVNATMYLSNGQPWWLVRALRKGDSSEKDDATLDRIIEHLGGDPKRDLITEIPGASDTDRYQIWFTWFNQLPLLDMQAHPDAKHMPIDKRMRIVPRDAPERDGYKRMPPLYTFTSRAGTSAEDLAMRDPDCGGAGRDP